MDLLIRNIRTKSDKKLITDLLKRLGMSFKELSASAKEDIAFGIAIEEGMKSGFAEEKEVMSMLKRKMKG
ncbi:MAG: hypothetical protein ABIT08_02820 [Bacteroidia bacterium]